MLLLVPPAWGLKPQEPRARLVFAIRFAIESLASLKVGKEVLQGGVFFAFLGGLEGVVCVFFK